MPVPESLPRDPEQLEIAYRQAAASGDTTPFESAVEAEYARAPGDMLLAAWHYRLTYAAERAGAFAHTAAGEARRRIVAWGWALPLGLLNGLLLWWLSDNSDVVYATNPITGDTSYATPLLGLLAAPITAAILTLFLSAAGRRKWLQAGAVVLALAGLVAYARLVFPQILPTAYQQQYLGLMVVHLAILSWAAIGHIALVRGREPRSRFAVLVKSLEAVVVAALLGAAWGIFTGITFALFNVLGFLPEGAVVRLFMAGGAGIIAVVSVALVFDPHHDPAEQSFDEGLSKLVSLLLRLLLPLAVVMLAVYLAFIPFNWREPFERREVLVAFNALLFAVMGLLLGATPVYERDLGERGHVWLRRGVIALVVLSLIISLYALAAIIYRTSIDRLTPNRLTFIGWNVVNIGILALLLAGQARAGRARWLAAMHAAFARGSVIYIAWALFGLLALPWLFRGDLASLAGLPRELQVIATENAAPVLLKCAGSPHVYLLERGEKRWVKDIPTFEARGYSWDQVRTVSCPGLRAAPDGAPIPPDAGAPPAP